ELAYGCIEPLDPQRPKRPLAPLAIPVGVLICFLDRLLGDANRVLAAAVISLGGLENLLVLGVGGYTPFDTGHSRSPLSEKCPEIPGGSAPGQLFGNQYFLMLSPSVLNSTLVPRWSRTCFALRLIMPWRLPDC